MNAGVYEGPMGPSGDYAFWTQQSRKFASLRHPVGKGEAKFPAESGLNKRPTPETPETIALPLLSATKVLNPNHKFGRYTAKELEAYVKSLTGGK
jgi:hypothetical protein